MSNLKIHVGNIQILEIDTSEQLKKEKVKKEAHYFC